jgi:antitoxin FitA
MGVNLSIKSVPEDWAERLRQRAERNHRSLQGELMAIVEQALAQDEASLASAAAPRAAAFGAPATAPDETWQRGTLSVEQTSALLRAQRGTAAARRAAKLPLAVDIIRAERDRR